MTDRAYHQPGSIKGNRIFKETAVNIQTITANIFLIPKVKRRLGEFLHSQNILKAKKKTERNNE